MIVLRLTGGIARNRGDHGAAQQSGVKDGHGPQACEARAALDGENAVIR